MEAVKSLRYLFYLVSPGEMAKSSTLAEVPDYIVKAIPGFFLMIAMEFCVSMAKNKPVYRFNDTIVSLLLGSLQMVAAFWIRFVQMTVYCFIWEHFHIVDLPRDSFRTWILALLLVEYGYYWLHRCSHESHILWSGHSVHHSGEHYNLATALRQGIFQAYYGWVFMMPCALFIHPILFAHHKALNTLFQFYIHTQLIGHLGPLEYIFNTPSHHRIHHRPPGNANYGGVLIIYDRLHGTFVPEDEQVDHYGLAKQYDTMDPLQANVEHLRRMNANIKPEIRRDFWFYVGLLTKRRVKHKNITNPMLLFEPFPPKKDSLWADAKPNKRVPYDGDGTSALPVMRLYTIFLFLGTLGFSVAALVGSKTISDAEAVIVQIVCFMLYTSIGRLFDGFEKGNKFNTFRILTFLCLSSWLHTLGFTDSERLKTTAVKALQGFTLVDVVMWLCTYMYMTQKTKAIKKID